MRVLSKKNDRTLRGLHMKKTLGFLLSLTLLAGPIFADDLETLRAQLAAQRKQIEELAKAIEQLETRAAAPAPKPAIQPASKIAAQPDGIGHTNPAFTNPCDAPENGETPPYLRIGSTCLTPVAFMDATFVARDKDAGSGIGTNFGSIPYNTAATSQLSEARFSPQNSRIGFRVDGAWGGAHFIGYNEFDFLGTNPSTGLTVTNGAFMPRLRLFWVDVRKNQWEFLGGQSWSLLTPNRRGTSPLPADIFYSQAMDVNYVAGLTWTRQPGVRVVYHAAGDRVAVGIALENPDQYMGGNAGGSSITLPSALGSYGASQLDNASNIGTANPANATPSVHPDVIFKVAVDPTSRLHFEIGGVERTFKVFNSNTTGLGAQQTFTAQGGGLLFGASGELFKGFRVISTNFLSDGGGRYLFGQAPDVAVRSDGSLSPIHADGTVDGIEFTRGTWQFFAYYGGIYIGRDALLDANGTTRIGYGFAGSPNSQNRALNEITWGFVRTFWKNPRLGALSLIGQYEYMLRDPWYVAAGAPKSAHDNTVYLNLRYTLPGQAPVFK